MNIIKTTLVWLVVLLAVSMMIFTVVSVTTFNRNDRDLFGYKMYIVNSDSMAATDFNAGSLILVKEVDPSTLKEGDIITFMSQDTDSFGEIITHKIRKVTTDAEGNPGFITYGTTTDTDDETIVTYPYVLGKYQSHVPGLGTFFNFLKTTPGYFVCIFIPFMLIIIYEGVKFFNLFRHYKKEQMEEMQAERDKIEAEKLENAKMLEELRALKAQLEGGQAPATVAATEEAVSDTTSGAETEWEPLTTKKEVDPQMLQFILGMVLGGIVGFLVAAVLSIDNSERDEIQPAPESCEIGDSDARSK